MVFIGKKRMPPASATMTYHEDLSPKDLNSTTLKRRRLILTLDIREKTLGGGKLLYNIKRVYTMTATFPYWIEVVLSKVDAKMRYWKFFSKTK